ncbi:pentatricopeptide repeat-containing protein At3g56030, mitochondrial-like [Humulus lupulus]|uniref:pentatricopeptide repeat-containing protein At3g56030, mitochondrial-like n=1 Tax=Humulus lupulus TaxID=3486 RepID=UPI002B4118EA|nr:pentatricopeptide repeat-containing protein At3g56030, mitochondrial-like [Humulus lupulus]
MIKSLFHRASIKAIHFQQALIITNRFSTLSIFNCQFLDKPTAAYYDELVNDAGSSGDFNTVRQLLNKRMKDCCYNTTNTFNFITENEASLLVLDNLILTLTHLDKCQTRNSAFNALILRLCKLGKIEESLHVIDSMARVDCNLNACSFYPIVKVLARSNKIDEAWRVVDLMRSLRVAPDSTIYNYILMTHCIVGDLSALAVVLTRMEEQKMKANGRTYDALVLGACRAGKVEGALVILRRVEDDGVPMLLSTRLYVIDALLSLGYYDQAIKFVRTYCGKDLWLDKESFGCLAIRLLKLNRKDEARLVLQEMRERKLEMRQALMKFQDNEKKC